jgi:hypothetical protein
MEQLALFALPRTEVEETDDQSEEEKEENASNETNSQGTGPGKAQEIAPDLPSDDTKPFLIRQIQRQTEILYQERFKASRIDGLSDDADNTLRTQSEADARDTVLMSPIIAKEIRNQTSILYNKLVSELPTVSPNGPSKAAKRDLRAQCRTFAQSKVLKDPVFAHQIQQQLDLENVDHVSKLRRREGSLTSESETQCSDGTEETVPVE